MNYLQIIILCVFVLFLILNSIIFYFLGKKKQASINRGWDLLRLNNLAESFKRDDNLWFTKDGWITGQNMEGLMRHTDPRKIHFEFVDQYGSAYFVNEAILDRFNNRIILFDIHQDQYDENGLPYKKDTL